MTKKMQQNLILLFIFAAGLGYVYYKFLITPIKLKYQNALTELTTVESKLSEMKRRAMELPKLQAEMQLLELEVSELEKLLPKDKEIPNLLRIITKHAQHYQLRISNFAPSAAIPQSNYNEIPFQMTLQGTYHSFAAFLAELGQESRILSARNITYTVMQPNKENASTVTVNFTLVAYIFKG